MQQHVCPPTVLEFPLRGEWFAPNTPGTRIPSHGTNRFGARYAFDFIQVDWNRPGLPAYRASPLHYLLAGLPLRAYYCWGQPVYAPCGGVVVRAVDHWSERRRTWLPADLLRAFRSARSAAARRGIGAIAGNHIIMDCGGGTYAAFAHLQTGSVQAAEGQAVRRGQLLGRVGHSGNSFAPHLHFQLMDSRDPISANGLPCAFSGYEVYRDGVWQAATAGIPAAGERIRGGPLE